jgi:hypothetical protein
VFRIKLEHIQLQNPTTKFRSHQRGKSFHLEKHSRVFHIFTHLFVRDTVNTGVGFQQKQNCPEEEFAKFADQPFQTRPNLARHFFPSLSIMLTPFFKNLSAQRTQSLLAISRLNTQMTINFRSDINFTTHSVVGHSKHST